MKIEKISQEVNSFLEKGKENVEKSNLPEGSYKTERAGHFKTQFHLIKILDSIEVFRNELLSMSKANNPRVMKIQDKLHEKIEEFLKIWENN
ncbi:hypothetical protein LR002_02635 [Candidatus Gracilibacteria bacterium]|nr:hypothetical protein [Candidatus Gracilibacteria bacterium]